VSRGVGMVIVKERTSQTKVDQSTMGVFNLRRLWLQLVVLMVWLIGVATSSTTTRVTDMTYEEMQAASFALHSKYANVKNALDLYGISKAKEVHHVKNLFRVSCSLCNSFFDLFLTCLIF
jgi:hypothetical protein